MSKRTGTSNRNPAVIRRRHRRDVVVAHAFARPAQARADDADEIARLQPAAAETFREGDEIVGAEGGLELGERAEREHEPPPCSAEFRLDLTAMLIRHGLLSRPALSVAPD